MTETNGDKQNRTPKEKQILEVVKERKGEDWVAEHEELILMDARRVGVL